MLNVHQSPSAKPDERHHRQQRSAKHTKLTSDTTTADVPWQQMTQTYTWVMEEEFIKINHKRTCKTEDWVRQQQYFFSVKEDQCDKTRTRPRKHRRGDCEEVAYIFGVDAEDWKRQEERVRRLMHEREKARARIQEELRRIETRFQQKRDADRRAREEAQRRATEKQAKEKRDRARLDRLIVEAWATYEKEWAALAASSEPLTFSRVPWPLILPPRDTNDITRDAIVALLFSPLHSQHQTRKDRIRSAQLRWHPDRFRRFLGRVAEQERATVEEGVGVVARCLNEMMEKEKKMKAR
ncbi:hypothetical protein JR316_0002362 [Psilocybe cubensis]|uniref:Uncharacterized protein n=2 Tax=Psilocybe cubensis TaxID=181762 RepID=A0ACB8HC95_PSICU|nr:hypothetical protein JR316_0002362 [Psilocybe cubensis]KAH9485454.1 hypothetical protein JR316_0002362 [Psilocybe cubensis]